MSERIYFIFPRGRQPTEGQISDFNTGLYILGEHRIGIDENKGGLAIEFDKSRFETAKRSSFAFEASIAAWEKTGGVFVTESEVQFREDETALRPWPDAMVSNKPTKALPVNKHGKKTTTVADKLAQAQEAQAMSRLEVQKTKDNVDTVSRAARYMPWAVAGTIAAATVAGGSLLYRRLANSPIEPRRDTIKRVAEDPMGENPQTKIRKEDNSKDEQSFSDEEKTRKNEGKQR